MVVRINTNLITDWSSFHDVFAKAFDFPGYYGRNMNAWIDCMSDLNEVVVLHLEHITDFKKRCPELYDAVLECAAFVNFRQIKQGKNAVLALSFFENAELVERRDAKRF